MLLFLNGIDNRKRAVNENYARELMELFTLGADRGAYTEKDVRELARALTGWRADWDDDARPARLPLRRDALARRRQDGLRPDGQLRLGGRLPAGGRAPVARRRSSSPSSGATSCRRRRPRPPARRSRRLYLESGHQIRPVLEAILLLPELYDGPAHGQAAGRVRSPGMLRALGPHITGEQWTWLSDRRGPAALPPAGRVGLGRQALAGLEHDPRRAGTWSNTSSPATRSTRASAAAAPTRPRRPSRRVGRRARLLARPAPDRPIPRMRCSRTRAFQPPADSDTPEYWQPAARPGRAQRQNALRHLIAVSPDYQTC